MELKLFRSKSSKSKRTETQLKRYANKFMAIGVIIMVIFLIIECEGKDKFYRPDMQEKICCIGIIDADDTASYYLHDPYTISKSLRCISFEKSYQAEYLGEVNDSLREFSFTISSPDKELINYQSDSTIKNLVGFKVFNSIDFKTGETYYLSASEKNTPNISAEIIVPETPSELTLNSINKEIIPVSHFSECRRPFDDILKYATVDISFYGDNKSYYALLFEGTGINYRLAPDISGFLDFSIRESNVPGFFAVFHGLRMYHQICIDNRLLLIKTPVYAYFIEGSKISGNKCNIALSVKFNDGYSLFDIFTSFRIKLLSVPRELYLFEKSLYTYRKVSDDPFSEPVYLNGNIKGGNGVFAICRSSDISIILPFPPY